ncbi:hypothetical protein J1N35_037639, partial [Gossypium stocksii]
ECTINLEDVQLQLRLPVDGSALTGSVQSADWGVLANLVGGLPCWQHCTGRYVGRWHQIKPKSEVAYHYYNHGLSFTFHFYVLE